MRDTSASSLPEAAPRGGPPGPGARSMNVDLATTYLGLALKNPLVVAACPLTGNLDSLRRLEDAGAAAVVLPSLFEEQVAHEIVNWRRMHAFSAQSIPEAMS